MLFIEWDNNHCIGIDEMDRQHQDLVNEVNRLIERRLENNPESASLDSLNAIIDSVQKHFADEEKLMESLQYPELKRHQLEHQKLTEGIVDYQKCHSEIHPPTNFELFYFLRTWLLRHITDSDKSFGIYFESKQLETVTN